MNLGKKEQRKSRIIHKWYQREYELHSYEARIPEERFLLQKVKNDPYHYLVNLVEMVARAPIQEMLRSEGINTRVFLASEQDNIISGVDLIIEEQTPDGVRYTGIDIAISKNLEYIEKKEKRVYTTCREFNAYKKHGEKRNMPRQVFAIPPIAMAKFLQKYMNGVITNKTMDPYELLSLFSGGHTETIEGAHEKVRLKVHTIMHEPV